MKEKKKTVTVQFDVSEANELTRVSKEEDRPKASVLRRAFRDKYSDKESRV